jgi:23S rRNA (guanosine2251-2'-O)-methyltransferase
VPLRRVSGDRFASAARTGAPQGVLARADPLPEVDLDDLSRPDSRTGRAPFLLALDGVTDPQNLGALLRTADGAGVTGAVLPRHRAAHVTPAAAKAAAGAIEWLPLASVAGIPSALAQAAELGLWVIGLHPEGGENLFDLSLRAGADGVVVVLGAEGKGLSPLVRRRCDVLATIPLRGALPSLNVAAAGAIALFELSRRFVPASLGSAPSR